MSTSGRMARERTSERYRPKKTAMLLAQRIAAEIIDRGLEPGGTLPPERDMLAAYQVGRGTLREALRFLEIQGVLAIKPGPGGGPIVSYPDSRHLASTIALLLEFARTPFRHILDARALLEPTITAMAAERADAQRLEEIQQSVDAMAEDIGDLQSFLWENERFHDLVAAASGNDLFAYLVSSLHWIIDGTVLGVDYPERQRKAVWAAHGRVYEAIRSGDPRRARDAMRDHLAEFATYVQRKYPHVMDKPLRWDQVIR
jgi:GntR family transcriptional repressor for pyruvate dehydrogenase complex